MIAHPSQGKRHVLHKSMGKRMSDSRRLKTSV
jgi:hypothetical protein